MNEEEIIPLNNKQFEKILKATIKETDQEADLMYWCIQHFPTMVFIVDQNGRYIFVNDMTCKTLGYTREEMLRMHVYDIDADITPMIWAGLWGRGLPEGGATFENRLQTKDGHIISVYVQVIQYRYPDGKGYSFTITRKASECRETETDTLQAALARQKSLLNNIPYIAWMKDGGLRYTAVNDAFLSFCGRKEEEVIGLTDFELWPQEIAEKIVANDWAMIENKTKVHSETLLQDAQGKSFWCEIFQTPIHDPSLKLHAGTVGIAQDISDRKVAEEALKEAHEQLKQELHERKLLESQLIQAQKMESVGQLAAGVAHEINNPIGFVQSNLGTLSDYVQTLKLLLEKYQALQQCYEDELDRMAPGAIAEIQAFENENDLIFICKDLELLLSESKEGLHRVKEIVQGLKSFARPEEYYLQETNINECLENTLKIIWNELKYKCTMEKEFQKLPLLKCYPGQLNQVFMNLLINASQAIQEKGTITLRTAVEDDHIVVAVSDDGGGIHPDNLDSIFNPFFTTKPVGQGTGLGLSISYGIVQKHQGKIEVESEIGKGSTFTVRLPINAHINQEEQPYTTVQPTVI